MNKPRVCCVIVSYNDFDSLMKTIEKVYFQVETLLVVDNGSRYTKQQFEELEKIHNIKLVRNKENIGVAGALNIGVDYALQNKYDYLLTLDQDSLCSENMVQILLEEMTSEKDIMIAAPRVIYNTKNYTKVSKEANKKSSNVKYVITSGNLVSTELYKQIGKYEEKLFIDSVDFDFCLRTINSNYKIKLVPKATLLHRLGEERIVYFFGLKVRYIQHNCLRNYYIFRNSIYILKKYWYKNPIFSLKKSFFTFKLFIENIMFHEEKKQVVENMLKGLKDGLMNKYGKYGN